MAAPQPVVNSSSPQWDNRNRAFIPPTELRQQSPSHDLSTQQAHVANINMASIAPSQPSFQPSVQPQARPRPQNSVTGTTHARTSFFSFRKSPNSSQATENKLGSSAETRSATLAGGSRPSSVVNEFGATTRPSQYDAQSIASKQPPAPDSASQLASPNEGQQQQQRPPRAQPPQTAPLHPEIRSVVQLTLAHARKVYYSGPLVRRLERQPDGSRPVKDEGWTDVWAQLGGTILSIWDMKMIADASKEGKEVPPTYINVQDAVRISLLSQFMGCIDVLLQFVQVLGSVTVPATASTPAKRYTDVLTLNTAGSNLLLFSCPSTAVLISWAAALRLSAWEKSHLEEIYTAHLLRITIPDGKCDTYSAIRLSETFPQSKKRLLRSSRAAWKAGSRSASPVKQTGNDTTWRSQAPPPASSLPDSAALTA
jgi:CCR4-NOT transcriptional complex subunit CAF120